MSAMYKSLGYNILLSCPLRYAHLLPKSHLTLHTHTQRVKNFVRQYTMTFDSHSMYHVLYHTILKTNVCQLCIKSWGITCRYKLPFKVCPFTSKITSNFKLYTHILRGSKTSSGDNQWLLTHKACIMYCITQYWIPMFVSCV